LFAVELAALPFEALTLTVLKFSAWAPAKLPWEATALASLKFVAEAPLVLPLLADESAELPSSPTDVELLPLEAFEVASLSLLACALAVLGDGPRACAEAVLVVSPIELH